MKASRLIQILMDHVNDPDCANGGDFEVRVYASANAVRTPHDMALDNEPVIRCWVYPGIRQIIIGTE
jgi:hypothetical protein